MGKGPVGLCLAAIALAAGSTPALAATDLAALLPEPQTSGWTASAATSDSLIGPFTADSYAAWLNKGASSSTPTMDPADLTSLGFVAGYAKEWAQDTTNDLLAERVFQFDSPNGADSWYAGIKAETLKLASYKSDIAGVDAIPNSFGVVLGFNDGDQWRIDFREANFVFIVHADSFSKSEDLASLALGQAQLIYSTAKSAHPPVTIRTVDRSLLVAGGVVIGAVILITLFVLVILIVARPGRHAPQPAPPHGAYLSPDGYYWWDGAAWRPTTPGSPGG